MYMSKKIVKISKVGEYSFEVKYDRPGVSREWVAWLDCRDEGEYQVTVVANHIAPDTSGKVVVKAVVREGAKLRVKGVIKIAKEAQGTNNFLEIRVLLVGDKSTATVDPQLEIEANQVKAGHAASIGRIDPEQILYLMSKGVGQAIAEREIIDGFLGR